MGQHEVIVCPALDDTPTTGPDGLIIGRSLVRVQAGPFVVVMTTILLQDAHRGEHHDSATRGAATASERMRAPRRTQLRLLVRTTLDSADRPSSDCCFHRG